MYTVIVGSDGSMVASVIETITQNSNLAHTLRILTPTEYCGYDVRNFAASLEYKTPESGSVGAETLTVCEEEYKGYVEYLLPIRNAMTTEAGDLIISMSFTLSIESEGGESEPVVLKTQPADLMITETDGWAGELPDDTLKVIDDKMIQLQEMQGELKDMQPSCPT